MPAGSRTSGWRRVSGANPVLGIYTEDPAVRVPYNFGLGVNDTGRISTGTRNGSAITFPDAYSFGEAIELRYTFAETGNSQRQGIFMDVRTSASNSSTVRGIEVSAQSEGNINVGVLSGGTFKAIPRGTSGTITNLFGVEGEITFNSTSWAGTTTLGAAIRGKVSLDDGATNTAIYGVYIDGEPISGAVTATAIFAADTHANITWKYGMDILGCTMEETNSGKNVTLIRFTGANGTAYRLVHDTDTATAVAVVTD